MKRHTLPAMAMLVVAGLTLTACSGSDPAPSDGDGQTVRILLEDERDSEVVESLLDQFAQDHPDITLDIEKLAYDSMRDKLVASFQSPDATYDLIMVDNPWMYDFVEGGFVQPLDDYIADAASDYDYDDFYEPLRSVNEIDGATYGVPMYNYALGYIYRQDLLDEAGVEVPTSMDELVDTVAALTTNDVAGVAHSPQRGYKILEEWSSWLLAAGGQMFDEDGNPTIDTPQAREALEIYIQTLEQNSPENSVNWAQDETIRSLSTGGAASIVGYNWLLGSLNEEGSGEFAGQFRLAPMPGDRGSLGTWSWAVPSNSASADAAWTFVEWVTSPEIDRQRVIAGGAPIRVSTVQDPEVQEQGLGAEYYEAVDVILNNAVPFADGANSEQLVQEVGTQLNEAVIGSKTIEQALADAQAVAEEIAGQ
ncbi:MAG: ABC transporter substrate-binding protein [Beutenbergiaceae bacterium]